MSLELLLGISVLGGLGAACRYVASTLLTERGKWSSPGAIALINVIGSFGLGIAIGLALEGPVAAWLATGFFGGFTTFGAVSFDIVRLAQSGKPWQAVWFSVGQLSVTVLFAIAGALLFTMEPR